MNQRETMEKIMAMAHTIAVVGFSSKPTKAGYYVPAYMQKHGYRIIPVNSHLTAALGEWAYPDLISVPESVDLVLIFQRSENVPPFVEQALAIKAKAIWMQLGIIHTTSAALAQQAGVDVVQNACLMVEHRRWKSA